MHGIATTKTLQYAVFASGKDVLSRMIWHSPREVLHGLGHIYDIVD